MPANTDQEHLESKKSRIANERIHIDYNEWLKVNLEKMFSRHKNEFQIHFVCECSDHDCSQRIDLSLTEYSRLRSMDRCYVVVKGHQDLDIEQVIGSNTIFEIVQKDLAMT